MNTLREMLACVTAAAFLAAITAGLTGCATPPPQIQSPSVPPQAAEPDFTNAHVDKQKFLTAVLQLGRSPERDTELLSLMSGAPIQPTLQGRLSPADPQKHYRAAAVFYDGKRIPATTRYSYGDIAAGRYSFGVDFELDTNFDCIRIEDLQLYMGAPTKITLYPRFASHVPPDYKPSTWEVLYQLPQDRVVTFHFHGQACSSFLRVYHNRID